MIILAIGCLFGAVLFNFNVGWGDPGAKVIRNTLAIAGGAFLIIPIVQAIVSNNSEVGQILYVGSIPLFLIGFFLAIFAVLNRKTSGDKTFITAMRGAVILDVIAFALAVIGIIISMKGGAR